MDLYTRHCNIQYMVHHIFHLMQCNAVSIPLMQCDAAYIPRHCILHRWNIYYINATYQHIFHMMQYDAAYILRHCILYRWNIYYINATYTYNAVYTPFTSKCIHSIYKSFHCLPSVLLLQQHPRLFHIEHCNALQHRLQHTATYVAVSHARVHTAREHTATYVAVRCSALQCSYDTYMLQCSYVAVRCSAHMLHICCNAHMLHICCSAHMLHICTTINVAVFHARVIIPPCLCTTPATAHTPLPYLPSHPQN